MFSDIRTKLRTRESDFETERKKVDGMFQLSPGFNLRTELKVVSGDVQLKFNVESTKSSRIDDMSIELIEKYLAARKVIRDYVTGATDVLDIKVG